jgi:hydroxymethylpyrimidine/phosphomethylpyrimidine kinase
LYLVSVLLGENEFKIFCMNCISNNQCSGVLCVVSANVATMAGGAMNETSVLKGGRLHQIAIQNKLPTVTFVQSVRVSFYISYERPAHFIVE